METNTHRVQKDGRLVNLPVYVSNQISDRMIEFFVRTQSCLTVNTGRISEQVVLPYLEDHFNSGGKLVDADGYDHIFDNGLKTEHKKLVIRKTTAVAKHMGSKEGHCDKITFHHPTQHVIYVIDSDIFFKNAILVYDKTQNKYDCCFYNDMKLEGKGKRIGCGSWKNTKLLLDFAEVVELD